MLCACMKDEVIEGIAAGYISGAVFNSEGLHGSPSLIRYITSERPKITSRLGTLAAVNFPSCRSLALYCWKMNKFRQSSNMTS